MPHDGTVAPSYASCVSVGRSMAYEIAHPPDRGAGPFWTINARGQGSNHAYGASAVQALTFGLRPATFRNVPKPRMPIFGVSPGFFFQHTETGREGVCVPRFRVL